MRISVVSFTENGARVAAALRGILRENGHLCSACAMPRHAGNGGLTPLLEPLESWTARSFGESDGIIFVGAAGIAVRAIAPHVKDKLTDPAVLSVDERANFVIPLLSGHMGGANKLARELAECLDATPVITTATDLNGRFAVDVWAKEQNLAICERENAKAVSVALLDGNAVGFCSDFVVESALPQGLTMAEDGPLGICVSFSGRDEPFLRTLHLVPRIVTLGVGCRKDVAPEVFEEAILVLLSQNDLSVQAVREVATIDLKAREPCILAFCEKYRLPLCTASAGTLGALEGSFSGSAFVKGAVGVDNVCERAAVLISGGNLLMRKQSRNAVTAAAAAANWRVRFGHTDDRD
ncbi:cobalamin biosynthesis protein CbiG [Anaerotruncus sp. AF02-27]|uniref:cobalt-precorrin 5A hydrolase n=1 Tax=Anaerotruncus TaxID=244127 RepID=UPI000E469065|nr:MULTISPECIES: cobalt-precorrin 5A hydrolase [Anaerotruncus]RGX55970.1 cobalamin biosynthesis protein CbiG [Anaerotruncus sp. AF02-27]